MFDRGDRIAIERERRGGEEEEEEDDDDAGVD